MGQGGWFDRSAARNQAWADEQRRLPPPTEDDLKRDLRRAFSPWPYLAAIAVAGVLEAVGIPVGLLLAISVGGLALALAVTVRKRRRRFGEAATRDTNGGNAPTA